VAGSIVNNGALVLLSSGSHSLGLVSGSGSLTQAGDGTTTLAVSNTFTGDTVVSRGVLNITTPLALQNSTLDYNFQGGTVLFSGALLNQSKTGGVTLGGLKGGQSLALSTVTAVSPYP